MESRLKERLTGAAILVALIVLIVPEIFHDRRSAPTPAGIAAAPASANVAPTRSYTIELAPQSPPAAASAAPPAAKPRPVVPRPVAPEARARPAPARPPAAAASGAAEGEGATAPAAVPPEASNSRVASASTGHAHGGGWTVQLGLFAKSANAEHLAHMAQTHGFDVSISRFGSRGLYRVAVAGIADRATAEQLSHRLRGAGLPAAILGPR